MFIRKTITFIYYAEYVCCSTVAISWLKREATGIHICLSFIIIGLPVLYKSHRDLFDNVIAITYLYKHAYRALWKDVIISSNNIQYTHNNIAVVCRYGLNNKVFLIVTILSITLLKCDTNINSMLTCSSFLSPEKSSYRHRGAIRPQHKDTRTGRQRYQNEFELDRLTFIQKMHL